MWSLRTAGALACLAYAATVNAIYYIDDADTSITYNSSAGVGYTKKWLHYSQQSNGLAVAVDAAKCVDGTATYTQCLTSDHCTMSIPFNGTGITLFVAQDPGDIYNTSISLDGGPASIHFAYSPPNNTAEAYNLTLYDIQGLQATTHTLLVGLAPGVSRLLFDYAAVTGDQPAVRASGAAVVTVPSSIMVVVVALAFAALRW